MILRVPVSRTLKGKVKSNFIIVGQAWVDCPRGHPAAGAMATAVAFPRCASRAFRDELVKSLTHLGNGNPPTLEMLAAYDMFNTNLETEEDKQ
jgi:hypothetical protein